MFLGEICPIKRHCARHLFHMNLIFTRELDQQMKLIMRVKSQSGKTDLWMKDLLYSALS